jgi:hypothetical protein
VNVVKLGRLKWLGHIIRANETSPCRKLTSSKREGTRKTATPSLRWLDSAEHDLRTLSVGGWKIKAQDRNLCGRPKPTRGCNSRKGRERILVWRYYPSLLSEMKDGDEHYTAGSCCTVYSKVSLALLNVAMQLLRCIKIHTSNAFVSLPIIRTLHVSAQQVIIKCIIYRYTQHQRKSNTQTKHTPDPQHLHRTK